MEAKGEDRIKVFMRRVPQPVTIVATSYKGRLYGVTVSSFTSVSLNPPLILVCIHRESTSLNPIVSSGVFSVNLLKEGQSWVSDRFAGLHGVKDKFENVGYEIHKGLNVPILRDALAWMACKVWRVYNGGDHEIILGEVVDSAVNDGRPLVYWMRGYRRLALD